MVGLRQPHGTDCEVWPNESSFTMDRLGRMTCGAVKGPPRARVLDASHTECCKVSSEVAVGPRSFAGLLSSFCGSLPRKRGTGCSLDRRSRDSRVSCSEASSLEWHVSLGLAVASDGSRVPRGIGTLMGGELVFAAFEVRALACDPSLSSVPRRRCPGFWPMMSMGRTEQGSRS